MRTLPLVLFLRTFPISIAQAQYALPASTMGAGATNAASAQFQVQGTVGQPVAGWGQGGNQIAALGFWFTAHSARSFIPTCGVGAEQPAA